MSYRVSSGPERIVCLTEEPTEILYALGQGHRIVGISAYTLRPPEARRDKPVVSAFVGGSVKKIKALEPDLVIGFSDIQAGLARDLIADNLQVLIFNQRSIQEILDVIVWIGCLVDQAHRAKRLVAEYRARLQAIAAGAAERNRRPQGGQGSRGAEPRRPRVYFEEWDDPTISAIGWVSELISIAGGRDIFADRATGKLARERVVSSDEIVARDPELVLASWCGKPFDRAAFESRPGFSRLSAVRAGRVHELPPEIILQPGPACLTDGLDALVQWIAQA